VNRCVRRWHSSSWRARLRPQSPRRRLGTRRRRPTAETARARAASARAIRPIAPLPAGTKRTGGWPRDEGGKHPPPSHERGGFAAPLAYQRLASLQEEPRLQPARAEGCLLRPSTPAGTRQLRASARPSQAVSSGLERRALLLARMAPGRAVTRKRPGYAIRGGGTRTPDLRFWRPPLYQLSYAPRFEGQCSPGTGGATRS
jgi:hypothetical protein